MLQHLLFTYQFNLQNAKHLVEDLTDEQMVQQPGGLVNHPAWTLGHLASASNMLAKSFGLESTFPADWEKPFKTGGTPSADGTTFPSKVEILAELSTQHDRVAEVIKSAEPALFKKESGEGLREHFPTIGDFAVFVMSAHEGSHIGQIAAWRRAMRLDSGTGN